MNNWLERTELLLGGKRLQELQSANVLVVGLGGVGAYAAEQLIRVGIGKITIVDGDEVQASNINRQLLAFQTNIGQAKADILYERFKNINPEAEITKIKDYISDEEMVNLVQSQDYDFVIDAIDTLSPKVHLIKACVESNIPLVSSMGAGARIDPTKVSICDISKSYNDRLAFKVRKALRKHQIHKGFKVVFSSELPNKSAIKLIDNERNKKSTAGTIAYLPAIFGLFCASVVIQDLSLKKA